MHFIHRFHHHGEPSGFGEGQGRRHGHGHHGRRGFGHGHHGKHGFGHGPRARRGDVQAAILALLNETDMHGYQIIQELGERSGGSWTPSPGSIYPALQLLEDQGLVAGQKADGKRVFSLTEAGKARAAELPEAPWEDFAGEGGPGRALREASFGLMGAVGQVARAGSHEQMERATALLNDARKQLYTMLASDE